ncbi:hypothetical protein Xen7305DRAFT_00023030 [Xenococcus sp. PCC 7305]|uniref:hypothetical protein n=1 Tax=Xenococcus sp. PCC 7305 TaxID=102125 RepID=UPI0002AC571D|nr:hypothetical protein [Xenococcus sp. PCC 7305]ELS02588.1 hypothetical protein Xen7305DRAFT_00023030 [Xenococcus sp. PCC 7305]
MSINEQTPLIKQLALNINASKWVVFTEKFILVVFVIVIVVDFFLAFNDVQEDTISEVIQNWSYSRFFVITWAWGVIGGHFFLARATPLFSSPSPLMILLGLTFLILVAGLSYKAIVPIPAQLILLILGTAAGHFLWPVSPVS